MRFRSLGATDLQVSEIGFGCGPTAGLMVNGSPAERRAAVAAALNLGITYFDTAPVYGDTASESHLGQALQEIGASEAVVGTKVALNLDDLDDIRGAVVRSVEQSLTRLRRDRVDLVHLHNRVALQRSAKAEQGTGALLTMHDVLDASGVAEAFERLREDGKIRYFGVCAFGGEPASVAAVVDSGRFQSVLAHYSILNPTAAEPAARGFTGRDYAQIMLRAAQRGLGVVAIRVLEAGALSGSLERHPLAGAVRASGDEYAANVERAQTLAFLTDNGAWSLPQVAIRYALMRPEISTVVVGFSTIEHLQQAAQCSDAPALPAAALSRVELLRQADSTAHAAS